MFVAGVLSRLSSFRHGSGQVPPPKDPKIVRRKNRNPRELPRVLLTPP